MTATIRRMARIRGEVTAAQLRRLSRAARIAAEADAAWKVEVVAVLSEGASFSEVSRVTNLSTNTLQRWKREAGK